MNIKIKSYITTICILFSMAACGLRQENINDNTQTHTPPSTNGETLPHSETSSSTETELEKPETTDTVEPVSYPLIYPMEGDYDYSFYLKGLYLSSDKLNDQLYIQPIRFSESTDHAYQIEQYTDEILALPLKPETQFHIINWNRDSQMAGQSLNQPFPSLVAVCVFDSPHIFFKYMKQNHGEDLPTKPMVLNLDQNGYVDLVVELYVP